MFIHRFDIVTFNCWCCIASCSPLSFIYLVSLLLNLILHFASCVSTYNFSQDSVYTYLYDFSYLKGFLAHAVRRGLDNHGYTIYFLKWLLHISTMVMIICCKKSFLKILMGVLITTFVYCYITTITN